ncbi:MAG: glycoside hydrolase family 65 protein, partial [bacterium]|nr:glycoside hydrolase family 65 protein [bacterium]
REIGKKGIIEQFEGYFKLKDVILDQVGQNGLPLIPSKISTMNWEETTLLKQADVVMLLCLLNDEFDAGTKKANFDYYALRTTHESSLSPAMHAVMASRVGQEDNAYTFFKAAARMDIDDVNGNTADGIHSACLGGVWQAVVFGFFGISVVSDMLSIDPVVPEPIKGLRLNLVWKEYEMEISAANESVAIIVSSSGRPELSLMVFSRNVRVKPGKRHVFVRK